MKPEIIVVQNEQSWEVMIQNQDFEISKIIVRNILKNLNNKLKKIHLFSVEFKEENEINEIFVDKSYFADTLEENLIHFEKQQMFEECNIMKKTIDLLRA